MNDYQRAVLELGMLALVLYMSGVTLGLVSVILEPHLVHWALKGSAAAILFFATMFLIMLFRILERRP